MADAPNGLTLRLEALADWLHELRTARSWSMAEQTEIESKRVTVYEALEVLRSVAQSAIAASEGCVLVPAEWLTEMAWMARQYDDQRTPSELAMRCYDMACTAQKLLAAAPAEGAKK